ncbi:MAG: M1 family peptidase [Gallionella sp.]|nr:M1 family peptidase [Gallionella sp.]
MMRYFLCLILTFFAASAGAEISGYVQPLPNHQLHVELYPEQHSLKVDDYISLPRGTPRTIVFSLHADLNPTSIDAEIKPLGNARESWMRKYSVTARPGHDSFSISYAGKIFHPLQQEQREARSFESTIGIIAEDGVMLNGDSGWYPHLELESSNGLFNFTVKIATPRNWRAISQGARSTAKDGDVVWKERTPQKEIHLIAGYFKEYVFSANGILTLVYLRNEDMKLAQRYLEAAVRYIDMYQKLIAPYPYAKFALVENFWETGYGMPSFTLLGSQVIRLPFIIDSSYPHEILHNWWGNSTYVDYAKGNWSEGLTAYMADHLLKEQKGFGAEYRRSTLQKYADFVTAGRDFPLTKFTSRNSASSEAVGYGKSMMMFHMLRRRIEDDRFKLALQNFYKQFQFKQASFADLESSFSQAANKDLNPFFNQWTERTGAPQLRLVSAQEEDDGDGFELLVKIEQTQPEPAYLLDVPIVVTMAGDSNVYSTVINMTERQAEKHIPLKSRPLRVDIDPEFDIFRRLDSQEMPAAFSQVLGAEDILIVLPRNASDELKEQYNRIAQEWQQQPTHTAQIKWDDEIDQLPKKTAIWLFGWENKFRDEFQHSLDSTAVQFTDTNILLGGEKLSKAADAFTIATQIDKAPVAWLAAMDARMLPMLARKLPHYAKYSYIAFNGMEIVEEAPVPEKPKRSWLEFPGPAEIPKVAKAVSYIADINNVAKGVWPVTNSPMVMAVRQKDGKTKNVPQGNLAKRNALVR